MPEIADSDMEPPFDLTIGVLGETDRAGLANAFEARGDVDAVAHQIAVALLDHVAEVNADPDGTPALRSTRPFCTSMAQRTASTTLRNSMRLPSPVRLTTRPWCTAMVGSMRSLRSALSRASVRSSSAPASRL